MMPSIVVHIGTFPETKADKAAAPDGSTTKPTSKAVKTADLGRQ